MYMKYISLLLASSLLFFSAMATAHHTMPPNPANQDHTASKGSKCDSDNDSEGRKSSNDDGK